MARCARCESTNVDYEGYCWTCEYQAPAPDPPPVELSPAVELPPPPPPPKPLGPRILAGVAAGVATVLGIVIGGVVLGAFRSNANLLEAQVEAAPLASPVAPDAAGGSAGPATDPNATCLAGTWKMSTVAEDLQVDGEGMVHFEGRGGAMIFRADGTGTWDVTGTSESGSVGGKRVTITGSGAVDFSYQVYGMQIQYTGIVSRATYTVRRSDGATATGPMQLVASELHRFTCDGASLTLSHGGSTIALARVA